MAPVYKAVAAHPDLDVRLTYTGQHYSSTLKDAIWQAFDLPEPDYVVEDIHTAHSHATQLAKMMVGCDKAFQLLKTDAVLVCGDANTNLAAGLVARKLNLELGHVESGLRSYDWSMPEEHNRIMLDHISDHLFAPTEHSAQILRDEKVKGNIIVSGNTVVDSLYFALQNDKLARPELEGMKDDFALFTAHRQENVDSPERLDNIIRAIEAISQEVQVVFPAHPRTIKMLNTFNMMDRVTGNKNVLMCEPLPYTQALWAIRNAQVVLTDSGGIQEESCILKTPCVTLRENTERPESVEVGANVIAGTNPETVFEAFQTQRALKGSNANTWENPFGDGKAAGKVSDAIAS